MLLLLLSAPAASASPAGKAKGKPAPAAPAEPPSPPLHPPIDSPVAFTWPPEGHSIPAGSEFVLGRVSDPAAPFTINGQTVTAHPKGGFIAWLPVSPGSFTFHAELSSGALTFSADRTVVVSSPAAPMPSDRLAIDPDSLVPRGSLELRAGDWFPVRMRATPGRRARARVGGRWRELREAWPGSYEAYLQVPPGESYAAAPVEYEIGSGWSSRRLKGAALVSATVEPPLVAVVRPPAATAKAGPGEGYIAFPPAGTRMLATGRDGPWVRVAFGPDLPLWIHSKDLVLSDAAAPPRAVSDNMLVSVSSEEAVVRVPLTDRVPFLVDVSPDAGRVTLRVFSALSHSNWISYEGLGDYVHEARWRQESQDTISVEVSLKPGRRVWGWQARWDGNALRLAVRRPPKIDPARPLAGLRVMLDPGHTSLPNDGTIGPLGTTEAAANYAIARDVAARLEKEGAAPLMSRASLSDDVPLADRPRLAVERGADVLVSLHNNGLPDGSYPWARPRGFMVFYYHPHSLALARAAHAAFRARVPLGDEGLKWGDLAVPRLTAMPSILIENAMLILPEQEVLVGDPAFRAKLAEAVTEGLKAFMLEAGERRKP